MVHVYMRGEQGRRDKQDGGVVMGVGQKGVGRMEVRAEARFPSSRSGLLEDECPR